MEGEVRWPERLRLNVSEARRLKQLEEQNAKLKRIVADQALDLVALKDLLSKNW